ncbi:hypothetical protein MHYP_G00181690 [Metynnis hypsauchen]
MDFIFMLSSARADSNDWTLMIANVAAPLFLALYQSIASPHRLLCGPSAFVSDSMEASPNGRVKTVIVPSELTVGPKNLSGENILFVKMITRMAGRAAFQRRSAVLAAALY